MAELTQPDLPEWASAETAGQVEEPDGSKRAQGWDSAERPAHQYMNWLQLKTYRWILYLKARLLATAGLQANTALTITSNTVTPTQGNHTLAAAGTVNTIAQTNHDDGRIVTFFGTDAQTVVFANQAGGTGQLLTRNGGSVYLDSAKDSVSFQRQGTQWVEVMGVPLRQTQLGVFGGTSASSATAYTATVPTFPAYVAGMGVTYVAVLANAAGGCTLNANGKGAVALKVIINGAKADPPANSIAAGAVIYAIHDGTDFLIVGGRPETGERLVGVYSPSAVSSLAITGLTAGTRYRVHYNLIQNTSTGILSLRFNNDSGNNYRWARVSTNSATGGTAFADGAVATSGMPMVDSSRSQATYAMSGEFEFQAKQGTLTSATLISKSMTEDATNVFNYITTGLYIGASDVTQLNFVTSAGTFTGKVLVYALGA